MIFIAAMVPLLAAPVSVFDGKPSFKEGEGRSYYVWRDGDTWHLRWTTFGSMHRFSGTVLAEGGKIESLKKVDVETERRVIAPRRAPHTTSAGREAAWRASPAARHPSSKRESRTTSTRKATISSSSTREQTTSTGSISR